eukprot:TRINITY_DN20839_c0_g2_i4.p3 TRINITY_DN20839_c0_g2~~TRINITY_DN20839_c0_g2_i4.p3  ORF type:complete len:185 (+),score=-8.82 TRINITY_DN20839_c0_g2_i4:1307-1861(+)
MQHYFYCQKFQTIDCYQVFVNKTKRKYQSRVPEWLLPYYPTIDLFQEFVIIIKRKENSRVSQEFLNVYCLIIKHSLRKQKKERVEFPNSCYPISTTCLHQNNKTISLIDPTIMFYKYHSCYTNTNKLLNTMFNAQQSYKIQWSLITKMSVIQQGKQVKLSSQNMFKYAKFQYNLTTKNTLPKTT